MLELLGKSIRKDECAILTYFKNIYSSICGAALAHTQPSHPTPWEPNRLGISLNLTLSCHLHRSWHSDFLGHKKPCFAKRSWKQQLQSKSILIIILSSWWFQPISTICSSNWIISPSRSENNKSLKPPPSKSWIRPYQEKPMVNKPSS